MRDIPECSCQTVCSGTLVQVFDAKLKVILVIGSPSEELTLGLTCEVPLEDSSR